MTHLSMEQLLACRETETEPGSAAAREHLASCSACAAELERVEQRVARLRALPLLQPARDQWLDVRARLAAERRRTYVRLTAWSTLAAAAGIALMVAFRSAPTGGNAADDLHTVAASDAPDNLDRVKVRSQVLEAALQSYDPERRALDGRTAVLADALQDRIARVDAQLQVTQLDGPVRGAEARDARLLQLWEERVGLLDALVDVRVTRASNVGL